MVRPRKEFKVARNGDSLQMYKDNFYGGSITLADLWPIILARRSSATKGESPQKSASGKGPEKECFPTNCGEP